ncbi:MAG: Stp1/IreP family PP2C-type Ser/Thr phosphatase [Candidatus Hydrogenedentes bacterium]|nr:Stp1/IreP family PP2C-type Ser/Thr phosphatase [Candidatus Hydrogenedentota bacterium]
MAGIPVTRFGPEDGGNYEHQWTGKFLVAHFLSDVGKKRSHNEDSCIFCAPEVEELGRERGILFAVADGMGGASAGEFASRLALQILTERHYSSVESNIPESLRSALEYANRRIFEEAENNPEYHGMGTTVSAVLVMGDCAYVAQVGDSRVYLARNDGSFKQITDDHSLVAEQVRNGYISEEEARTHSLKNLITRAVGIKDSVKVDLFATRLRKGDTLLICSDGMSNLIKDDEIARLLTRDSLQAAARVLVGRALEEGGSDNITAVLVRVSETPPKAKFDPGPTEISLPPPGLLSKLRRLIS